MASMHFRLNERRRLVGLLASALILIFAALPASQAGAATDSGRQYVADDSYFCYNHNFVTHGTSCMQFRHQNGSCAHRIGQHCTLWLSGRGANNFIVYGPYEILPYGYYNVCWYLSNVSSPSDHNPTVWVQTTGDSGGRYLGGMVATVTPGFHAYCYWAGSGYAVGNVEMRAIIGNPRYNSQVYIGEYVDITRYY
jgi:hypothetical protein